MSKISFRLSINFLTRLNYNKLYNTSYRFVPQIINLPNSKKLSFLPKESQLNVDLILSE